MPNTKRRALPEPTPADVEDMRARLKSQSVEVDEHLAENAQRRAYASRTQEVRGTAALAGATAAEIARAEGISPQAVAKSLTAPATRLSMRDLLEQMVVVETAPDGTVTHRSFQQIALETLVRAMSANKVFTYGSAFVERPDWPTRMNAACRILDYSQPEARAPEKPGPFVEEAALETTTVRQAVRRTTG